MNENFLKLEQGLKAELALGEKFIALLERKKESIIKNKIDVMDDLNKEENQTIQDLEELAYQRQDLVLEISNTDKKLRVTENLNDLIMQLDDKSKENLLVLRKTLLANYQTIAHASKVNGELLAQSIGFTQHMYKRMSAADKRVKNGNYSSPYQKKNRSNLSSTILRMEG